MPYYHCRKCQHEFEYISTDGNEPIICDWCGADTPHILENETPLEKMANNWEPLLERLKDANIRKR